MDEPELDLRNVKLSPQKDMVRVFYKELWNRADKNLIPSLLHPDFTFRSSLGATVVGHDGLAGLVDLAHATFSSYTTDILLMIEEGPRICGKVRFHGYHRKELLGVPPSGRHVWWIGMPIFTFEHGKIRDLYVLGDVHGLIAHMKGS